MKKKFFLAPRNPYGRGNNTKTMRQMILGIEIKNIEKNLNLLYVYLGRR